MYKCRCTCTSVNIHVEMYMYITCKICKEVKYTVVLNTADVPFQYSYVELYSVVYMYLLCHPLNVSQQTLTKGNLISCNR